MARDFTKNVSNYMGLGVNKLASRFDGKAFLAFNVILTLDTAIGASDGDDVFGIPISNTQLGFSLRCGASGGQKFTIGCRSATGDVVSQAASSSTTPSTGTEYSVAGVVDIAGDSIKLFVNGALETTQGVSFGATTWTSSVPTTYHESIGSVFTAGTSTPISTSRQVDGRISELAFWAGATPLADADIAALHNRYTAPQICPSMLVGYFPLNGAFSPEPDLVNGFSGTITGTVAAAAHPRIILPARR